MSNGFDMSSNDQHILHYLFPQGKFVAIQLSEINSCTKCWSHVPFEKLYFYWPSPKTSFNFLCCFAAVEQQVALIPLVGYGVLDVCGSMWGLVWYVHIKQHREYDRRKWLKRRHNSSSHGSSHYYVTLYALLPLDQPAVGNILAGLSSVRLAQSTRTVASRLRPLSIFQISWSTGISTSSLGLFSRTVESINRLSRVVGFGWVIDGKSHRFSPNVLCEDLADCFIQV